MTQTLSTSNSLAENLIHTRIELIEFAISHSLEELLRKTLDEVCILTKSPIGFYHFVEKDQKTLSLQAWSTRTVNEFCKMKGKGMHYPIDQAGVWVDCVHARKPIIHNDYSALTHKKGIPDGHAAVIRELVVPIMRADRIVAILGIGNKPSDYTEKDVQVVSYIADVVWEIVDHKRMEAALWKEKNFSETVLNSLPGIFYLISDQGRFLRWNHALEQVSGFSGDEISIMNPLNFFDHEGQPAIETAIQTVFDKGWSTVEAALVSKDGRKTPFLFTGKRLEDQGHLLLVGMGIDITELKKTEKALKEREERYRTIFNSGSQGFYTMTDVFLDCNEQACRLWGCDREDIIGHSPTDFSPLIQPDGRKSEDAARAYISAARAGTLQRFYWQHQRKDGKLIDCEVTLNALEIKRDQLLLAAMTDITERRKAETALRESQRKYQNIIEKSDDVIWTTDLDIDTTYVSPSIEKKLGFTPEERMAQSLEDQMPPSSYKTVMDRLAIELEKEADKDADPNRIIRMEVEYYHKNGSILWFENIVSGLRDENGLLTGIHGISRDITDKVIGAKALQESEDKYRLLAENSADVIYKLNIATEQCTYASPAILGLLGYTVKEILSLKIQNILTRESYVMQRKRLIESVETGHRNSVTLELEAIHKEGHAVPVEINANLLYDEHGNPVEILGVARDITERKLTEAALLEEKRKLEDALLEIKKLSGLLPICSSCKNIRDDKGYWNQIETYLKKHSEAEFTHSICPKCAKKLYPDLDIHDR